MTALPWVPVDGGRADAGFRGDTGECVTRALAIATGTPYREVYDSVNELSQRTKHGKRQRRSNSRTGVHRIVYERWLLERGWRWTATMRFGEGTRVHLAAGELPAGRLVVAVSKHLVAVIDGVIHDSHDPTRDGTRCVYGYYAPEAS